MATRILEFFYKVVVFDLPRQPKNGLSSFGELADWRQWRQGFGSFFRILGFWVPPRQPKLPNS